MIGHKELSLTVMVVEDTADIRELLKLMLEMRGYRVVEAEDGQQAIEIARRECPDLILMDISLPVLDGLSAVRILREIKEMCNMPIVAVSANDASRYRPAALAAGCNEYLTKPMNTGQLDAVLGRFLH